MNHVHYFVKTLLVSLILFTTAIPINAAEHKTALCNSCNDLEMQAKAISSVPTGGKVHVIDFVKNKIKALNVHSELGLVTVVESSVSNEVENAVAELRESVEFMRNPVGGEIPLSTIQPYMQSPTVIGSAHSLAYSAARKRAVAHALAEYFISSLTVTLKASADALGLGLVRSTVPINYIYTIKFADGTTYEFIFKSVLVNMLTGVITIIIEPKHGSGRDGDAKIPDIDGGYDHFYTTGSSESLARLLSYAQKRGIAVNFEGQTTKATVTIIDCKGVPDGKMICVAKE